MNPIDSVRRFLVACNQTTDAPNARQAALYTGMQCEELAEKLLVLGLHDAAAYLEEVGMCLKRGAHDEEFVDKRFADLLDADLDLVWVTLGAAQSLGADVDLGWELLHHNNFAKVDPDTGRVRKDANGKVIKPEGHKTPNFSLCFKEGL